MALPRRRHLALLIVVLASAALLAIAWLTREKAPDAPVASRPRELAVPPSAAAPASTPVRQAVAGCPPELSGELLRDRRFSEPWAMCRLFGNHDAERGTSRAPGAVLRIVLSRGFADGPAERHVLVVARDAADVEGAVLHGRGASTALTANVFERGGDGWRFATSGEVGVPDARAEVPRLELLRVGPARHGLLVGGTRPDLATIFALSEMGVPALLEDVPLGGTNAGECQPPRCFAWKAEVSFERGKDPDYDDAVIRLAGTRPDDDERVWPVNETTRWVRRGGRYAPEP